MNNYLHEFIIENKRRPTEAEVGALMLSVAKSEPGRAKTDGYMNRFNLAQQKGALGGRQKEPKSLSDNAMKINDLLKKDINKNDIAKILDLSLATVRSITKKQCLPRSKDMISNYRKTKWS
jgi:hypothetical protein